jgi:EAL domain-containing protein (putative c-di-GMP-specific phosphodiesterase class I)
MKRRRSRASGNFVTTVNFSGGPDMATVQFALHDGRWSTATDFADAVHTLAEPFAAAGAAAMFVVRMPLLADIERSYGPVAFDKVTCALFGAVQQFAGSHFSADEYVVASTSRSEEVVIIVIRSRAKSGFYSHELPRITHNLSEYIEGQSNRIVYPYGVDLAGFFIGHAVSIHNPSLRGDRQLLCALENARMDAELCAQLRKREIGQLFLGLVLDEQVHCLYQPIVAIRSGRIYGYEALVRGPRSTNWQSPSALFRIAEEHGLAYELDCLCRKAALKGYSAHTQSEHKLFLNCLPSAIHDPSFSERHLRQTLESCGLKPSDLVLEVSERESIKNFSIFRDIRERYRSLGIKVALDDTGAGYAGLEAVMQLAPDFIKVDISLVRSVDRDSGRRVLLKALQDISEVIGAQVIAEGIETDRELEALREMGIPFGQGYLLGRPNRLE